jgi:hypothetical protein
MLNYIYTLSLSFFVCFILMHKQPVANVSQKTTQTKTADTLTWEMMSNIQFNKKQHPEYGIVKYPVVNEKVKALNKKRIIVSGYIIPLDPETYVLSKYVFASCFFCGGAGPETVMGIHFKDLKKRLKTDQYVVLSGTLEVNETLVEDWIYHIKNAVIIE